MGLKLAIRATTPPQQCQSTCSDNPSMWPWAVGSTHRFGRLAPQSGGCSTPSATGQLLVGAVILPETLVSIHGIERSFEMRL